MADIIETPQPKANIKGMNKAVLVVGGAGYIGSHTAKELLKNGFTPVVVDRDIKTKPWATQYGPAFECNLPRDTDFLKEIVHRYNIDSCIHFAAYTKVGESITDPSKYYKNNVVMTIQLLDKLREMNVNKITSKTYHYYINTVIEFLTWCEAQGYIENTRFKTILQSSKKNIPKRGKFQKVNFDKNDLKKIFESKQYISGTFKKATDYWVPLIALFTGARLGEICQLKVTDIKKSDGIYCIDINEDDEDKSIKTKVSSVRLIPIHQELLNLGLIEYVDELKKLKKKNLFEITYGIIRGQYHSTQKQMSAYLKKVGITSTANKSKSFHSFRHTVRTRLAELDIEERTIDAIIGHSSEARSIGSKMYTHTKLIKQKQSAIKKLTYDIDFTKMKKWKDCKFAVL